MLDIMWQSFDTMTPSPVSGWWFALPMAVLASLVPAILHHLKPRKFRQLVDNSRRQPVRAMTPGWLAGGGFTPVTLTKSWCWDRKFINTNPAQVPPGHSLCIILHPHRFTELLSACRKTRTPVYQQVSGLIMNVGELLLKSLKLLSGRLRMARFTGWMRELKRRSGEQDDHPLKLKQTKQEAGEIGVVCHCLPRPKTLDRGWTLFLFSNKFIIVMENQFPAVPEHLEGDLASKGNTKEADRCYKQRIVAQEDIKQFESQGRLWY